MICTRGPSTTAHESNLAAFQVFYSRQAKNGFYIFKWLLLNLFYKYICNLDPGSLKDLLSGPQRFADPWFIHWKNKWFSAARSFRRCQKYRILHSLGKLTCTLLFSGSLYICILHECRNFEILYRTDFSFCFFYFFYFCVLSSFFWVYLQYFHFLFYFPWA